MRLFNFRIKISREQGRASKGATIDRTGFIPRLLTR